MGEKLFTFGKYKDVPIGNVPDNFLVKASRVLKAKIKNYPEEKEFQRLLKMVENEIQFRKLWGRGKQPRGTPLGKIQRDRIKAQKKREENESKRETNRSTNKISKKSRKANKLKIKQQRKKGKPEIKQKRTSKKKRNRKRSKKTK